MAQLGQTLIPLGIDIDSSPLYVKSDKAYFLKGIEDDWYINAGKGSNAYELKPAESNSLYCSVILPDGINTVIGYFYLSEATEGYVVVHNTLNFHFIYRIQGLQSQCRIVYNFCQNFPGLTSNPKDFFSEGRIAMKSLCKFLPDGTKELYKELLMVNKQVENIRIVVEDSIATNSFSTPFFTAKDSCCGDRCRLIKTGVPTPMGKIKIVPIPTTDTDKTQNTMPYMVQFRFVDETAWGQRSEHGLISEQYFKNLAGCSKDFQNQPHCVWLETLTPCPEIIKRTLEIRTCELQNGGIGTDGNTISDWREAFTFDLYDKTDANLKWYQRSYNTTSKDFEFFNDGKNIRVKFCNNKECKTIPIASVRSQNPSPIKSGTVASIGKELVYGDNENNLDPFLKKDIDAVSLRLDQTASCPQKYARIKVYAVVHNLIRNQNNPIYARNGKTTFGGFGQKSGLLNHIEFEENVDGAEGTFTSGSGHGQTFPDGVKGFRGGLAGTGRIVESEQYLYDATGITKIGVLQDKADEFTGEVGWGRKWAVQVFDFGLVPLGNYFFEIYGHNDSADNLQNTSTYYIHTTSFNFYNQHWGITQNYQKRIFIDTTSGNDYDGLNGDDLAVIADLTNPQRQVSQGSHVVRGYIFEDKLNKIPINKADVRSNVGTLPISSGFTDHNGFYFGVHFINYKVQLFGLFRCAFNYFLGETGNKTHEGTNLAGPIYVSERIATYQTDLCNRYVVKGKITECGNSTNAAGGIAGVAVIMQSAAPAFTNTRGEFTLISHYGNGTGPEKMIFSVSGCFILDCNCQPVNIVQTINQPLCINCNENIVQVGNYSLQTIVTKGNIHGSRVQIGMIGHDVLGRQTDIQTSEKMFIDFPTVQEQGNTSYPKLIVVLPEKFSPEFCSRYRRLTFFISKNTVFEDFTEWAADKVEFVDTAGNLNTVSPASVKIWYRSLNGYNIFHGGRTNTTWSVVSTDGSSKVGDIAEFIQNVDGKYLPPNTSGNIQYDSTGAFFLVDYDDSLKDLKDGVKFRLKRPYACEIKKQFNEFGFPINFCADCQPRDDDGNIVKEFFLNSFSSYMIPRTIPVVTDLIELVPASGGGTQQKITEKKSLQIYPFLFEHHSPSDTWGDHCNNGGRVSYTNPWEGKKCDRNQLKRTGALNQANDGAINYLHYFGTSSDYLIDEQGWGGITAILVRDDGQILLVCEGATFSLRANDDRARVEDGYVRLPSSDYFSRPERNPSFSYGCQPKDINTIRRKDSTVAFLDSNKQAIVIHNFNEGVDISGGIQSWLFPSIKEVANSDAKYWHFCFDGRTDRLYITKFNLSNRVYENQEIDLSITSNETIYFDMKAKIWGKMMHFTPEYYGAMYGEKKDSQFFSFKDGLPWSHHNVVNPTGKYLNYFGVQCFPVIGVVTNEGGTEDKSFVSSQVYCREILFILERLETSLGQKSKVYEGQWEWGEGFSYAPYLCDTENLDAGNPDIQDALMDGEPMYGRWLKALYIPNEYNGEYFILTAIVSYFSKRDNGS